MTQLKDESNFMCMSSLTLSVCLFSIHSPKIDIRQRHFSRHFDDIDLFDKTIKECRERNIAKKGRKKKTGK